MPVIGWFIGSKVQPLVKNIDHWIALCLLLYVGIKMIQETFSKSKKDFKSDPSKGKIMIMLATATSIDALVVGFSFAMMRIDIWYPGAIIGVIKAIMSIIGLNAGKFLGTRYGNLMAIIGGLIIIGIGIKIFMSHVYSL